MIRCTSCGAEVSVAARFCPACGHALHAPADERRVVTVVFGDLVGFTALSEARDPEAVKNLVDRCFEHLAADVTRFGGRVDKIVGDAIVALFGAPTAHEDDAERAVRAALAMQHTLAAKAGEIGVDVRMRVGVNTGEVLVGAIRAGDDYTAMGDVVNTASRLQSAAAPGQVLVGPATHAATRDVFRYEPVGPFAAKGKEAPVLAWAALESTSLPGRRPRGIRAPLVGREAELAMLRAAVDAAVTHSRGQLVLLLGEAGVGKSRLAEELKTLACAEHGAVVLEGRCLPYGEANVWWPVAEALQGLFDLDPEDPSEEALDKCRRAVATALGLDPDSSEVGRRIDGFLYLLGYSTVLGDLDPARAQDEALRSVRVMVEALAQSRPVLIVLTDLHWADAVVLGLLDRLFDRLRGLPVVLVATARPELQERWTPPPGRHNLLVLTLDPLVPEETGRLVGHLLGGPPPEDIRALLVERSGGNPFFVEELVSLLGEAGVLAGIPGGDAREGGVASLPATLHGIVAARLDALDAGERALIEDAAVVGRTGSLDTLVALARSRGGDPAVLEQLADKDLLVLDGTRWQFKSDLVREVAYGMLTKTERARRHARLASWLSERSEELGRAEEELEQIAHHDAVAARIVAEMGPIPGVPDEIREQALTELDRAAARAEQQGAGRTAEHLLNHALSLVGEDEEDLACRFHLERARTYCALRELDSARSDAHVVTDMAERMCDRTSLGRALTVLGEVEQKEGDMAASITTLDRAVAIAEEVGDRQGAANALRVRGMSLLFTGDLDAADESIARALVVFRELEDRRGEAWARQNLAWRAFLHNDLVTAEGHLARSLDTFADVGDWSGVAWARGLLAFIRFRQGRMPEAEELAAPVIEDARDGDRWALGMMLVLLSGLRLWSGRAADAVEMAAEARSVFRGLGDHWGEFQAVLSLSRSLVVVGRISEALALEDDVWVLREGMQDLRMRDMAYVVPVMLAAHLGSIDRIRATLPALQEHLGGHVPVVYMEELTTLALAHLELGDVEAAAAALDLADEHGAEDGEWAFARAVRALAAAVDGRPHDVLDVALLEPAGPGFVDTYFNRMLLSLARGFALAQLGRTAEAEAALDEAVVAVDATDARFDQAVARLARGRALEALGEPEAVDAVAEALRSFEEMGWRPEGWEAVFELAATAERSAPHALRHPGR